MTGTAVIVIITGVNRKFTAVQFPRQWPFLLVVKVGWRQTNLCEVKRVLNIWTELCFYKATLCPTALNSLFCKRNGVSTARYELNV
jgi:hypothetical protein